MANTNFCLPQGSFLLQNRLKQVEFGYFLDSEPRSILRNFQIYNFVKKISTLYSALKKASKIDASFNILS